MNGSGNESAVGTSVPRDEDERDQSTSGEAPRRSDRPRVSVVIPALNEAENLPEILGELPASIYELVLVDGHSIDGTVEVARALFPTVRIVSQTRRGKGNALVCGFAAARGDVIVALDADGSTQPHEIGRFVDALIAGADFVKGSRFLAGGGSDDITLVRRTGNKSLCGLVNFLFRVRYTDLCYGYNAFWRECLSALALDCDGFEVETLMNVRAAKAGLLVTEVPSYERSRIYGKSNLHPIRDGMRVLRTICREWIARDVLKAALLTPADGPPAPRNSELRS